jgi:hypothetical protein
MLVYGVANAVEDFRLDQFMRRGWTNAAIPDCLFARGHACVGSCHGHHLNLHAQAEWGNHIGSSRIARRPARW